MSGPLGERKPQRKTQQYSEHHRGNTQRERNPEGHQHRARRHNERKTEQAGDSPRQRDQRHAEHGDSSRARNGIRTALATKLLAVSNGATWYHHARNAIRFLTYEVSLHGRFVAIALVCALSARMGSELASRTADDASRWADADAPLLWWGIATAAVIAAFRLPRRRWLVVLTVVFALHGAVQWHDLATPQLGEFSGVAFARSDPVAKASRAGASSGFSANARSTVSLIVEVEGENFRLVARGRARNVLHGVRMGDALLIDAQRTAYDTRRLRFVAGRHIQGELRNVTVHATAPSLALWHRAANRIHELIDRGSRTMPTNDAALVRGLVLGDESRQPFRMTESFRDAGLGHLLAVSGQNVVLLLAAILPLLRRLSPWSQLMAALSVVAMFALVTRLESSVIRASVMAAVVQVGFVIGRDVAPLRALALTVTAIVAMDPLATWSIGFVLSAAATFGLIVITPWFGKSIFAATTAAQLGVAPFVMLWFGSMPSVALLTNLLAVPVASFVMIAGPPLLASAAFLPDALAALVTFAIVVAVRLVWWVAEIGAWLAPPGWLNVVGWAAILTWAVRSIADEVRYVGHPRARL